MFGEGAEERLEALALEMRLRGDATVTKRRNEYYGCLDRARAHAASIGKDSVINELMERTPSYIINLLETEDDRFGAGSLFERYARTFWKNHK